MSSFDPCRLKSRAIPIEHWETHRHVTWSTTAKGVRPQEGDVVHKYGQSFVWRAAHWHSEDLNPLRQRGDALADALVSSTQPGASSDLIPR